MKILNLTSRKCNNAKITELSVNNFKKIKKLTTIVKSISSDEVFDRVDQILTIANEYFEKEIRRLYKENTDENLEKMIKIINNKQALINPHPLIGEHLVPALQDNNIYPVYGIYTREIKPNESKQIQYTLNQIIGI